MHFYEISVIYRRNYQRFDKEIIMVSNHYTVALLIFSLHLFFFSFAFAKKVRGEGGLDKYGVSSFILFFF